MPRAPANPYTMAEKRRILQYIIKHEAYYQVKGNSLWIKMQSEFGDAHSWQSLKEHFKKRLLPSLALADFKLTEAQITNFRRGSGSVLNLKKKGQAERSLPVPFYKLWSSDEENEAALPGTSENKNNKNKEDLGIKAKPPGPDSSGFETCTKASQKEKMPVLHTNNNVSRVPAPRKPTVRPADSSEDEPAEVDSQVLSCDVDSDETYVDSDECIDDSRVLE